jgi:selenocysteine lyase/cysteine desulfurase
VVAAVPELLERLQPDKLMPSTNVVPERFELGTLPYELLAGTTAAVDFLAELAPGSDDGRRARLTAAMTMVDEHEDGLRLVIEKGLAALPGVVVHSRARSRTPTLLLTFTDREVTDAYEFLGAQGINAPAGTFYAYETARRLGLGDVGGLRVGLAPYSSQADIDRLLDGLHTFLAG